MALITCPDCGKHISDRAPTCPHCGRPMQAIAPAEALQTKVVAKEGLFLRTLNVGCALVLLFVIAIALLMFKSCSDISDRSITEKAKVTTASASAALDGSRLKLNGWRRDVNGDIAVIDVRIENGSLVAIKKIDIQCIAYDGANAELSRVTKNVAQSIPSATSITLKDFALGRIDRKSNKLECKIAGVLID